MNYYEKSEIFAWMPLIGFDKDAPDKGVSNFIERTGYTPHGVCLFTCHPDIINQHEGMDKVCTLPPDDCSYTANPYNEERSRQEWTNHDLKALVSELNARGVETFLSISGDSYDNQFHDEWIYEHPEIQGEYRGSPWAHMVLKRFEDGTYYEDFFVEKLCAAMKDYGLTGFHVIENFCPQGGTLVNGDFSYDMLEQFMMHTGFELPKEIIADRENTRENVAKRGDWIWANIRAEWIEFYAWRWEQFWKKICDRLHAINCKAFVLGMYCTDPFDTLYDKGIDLRRIVNAGVDYLMPNVAANGSATARIRPWRYHEWANMVPLTDAFAPNARKLNMLGVKDTTEEWDMLHHAPNLLDRDISFLASYMRFLKDGTLKRCLDGYNICLADGIYKDEWAWLKERFDIAFDSLPERVLAPTLVWSDAAFDNMLRAYIKTRRWSVHKFIYELNKIGTHTGAVVRTEDISDNCGDLFVPNFDLLSEDEKKQIAGYTSGAVIATASVENFNKDDYNCTFYFEDKFSPYKMCAFALNLDVANSDEILALLDEDDGTEPLDLNNVKDVSNTLREYTPFQKVSVGFINALSSLIKAAFAGIVKSTHPIIPMKMSDGAIRVLVINDDRLHYAETRITTREKIREVKVRSKYPILPVKFASSPDAPVGFATGTNPGEMKTFRVPVPQGGMGIVDIYLA